MDVGRSFFLFICFHWVTIILSMQAPQVKHFQFSGDLRIGIRTMVMCGVIEGEPPFRFQWFKDGIQLQDSSDLPIKITDEFTSILTIKKLDSDSNGNYTCRVSNAAGVDERSDVLKMKSWYTLHPSLLGCVSSLLSAQSSRDV